jgi:4-carboxymuconolactone decarboxylase
MEDVMSRLPAVDRGALAPEDQAIWDRIAAVRTGLRDGAGPFGVLMHVPALAERIAALEDYFRDSSALAGPDRELTIMATARELNARYAWVRHEARGREVGTRPEAIEVLRANDGVDELTPREQLLVEMTRSLLRSHTIPAALFDRAMKELGQQQLIELVALVGQYTLVGLVLGGFEVPPPEGARSF